MFAQKFAQWFFVGLWFYCLQSMLAMDRKKFRAKQRGGCSGIVISIILSLFLAWVIWKAGALDVICPNIYPH